MKMQRLNIQLPAPLKARLDRLRAQGYTASGFIRHVLEQHFSTKTRKGRHTV
jgi:metal-responsive CopG/Arc/MetJ family transcriptional regulator